MLSAGGSFSEPVPVLWKAYTLGVWVPGFATLLEILLSNLGWQQGLWSPSQAVLSCKELNGEVFQSELF